MGILSAFFKPQSQPEKQEQPPSDLGVEASIAKAQQELASGNSKQALELLDLAAIMHPSSTEITRLANQIRKQLSEQSIHKALLQLDQDSSSELRSRLSDLYRKIGDSRQAMHYGNQAIQIDRNHAGGYQAVGFVYLEKFRSSLDGVAGMNALRYLSKAHSLAPRNSRCLLLLAEVFVILKAPIAAEKFLAPVSKAFPEDPSVKFLLQQIGKLPREKSTQIQDLFIQFEKRHQGNKPSTQSSALASSSLQDIVQFVKSHKGTQAFYILDMSRKILAGFNSLDWDEQSLGEYLGLLSDTARLNSERMSLGHMRWFEASSEESFVLVYGLTDQLTAFYLGESSVKREDILTLTERVRAQISDSTLGGAA